jgi:hypothetical protein
MKVNSSLLRSYYLSKDTEIPTEKQINNPSPDVRCRRRRFLFFFSRRREQAREFVVSMDGLWVFWVFAGW